MYELLWFCPCCNSDDGELHRLKKDADKAKKHYEKTGRYVRIFKTDQTGNRVDPKSYGFWLNGEYTTTTTNEAERHE